MVKTQKCMKSKKLIARLNKVVKRSHWYKESNNFYLPKYNHVTYQQSQQIEGLPF